MGQPYRPQKSWATKTEDWELHKETIKELWWDQNKHLRDVVDIMGKEHGFYATYAPPTRPSRLAIAKACQN
ncbi:hypothetical protein BX600DRAFT_462653 [Xylariales sp. PMI_506]|nr:hypothetical protein BX600DRAFT_462653 [Xylariales sp. PMI_506]